MENFYSILGVAPSATTEEIRDRFRFLAQAYHPDKFSSPEHKKLAEDQFKRLNEAYQTLVNPAKREQYNNNLLRKAPSSATGKSQGNTYRREHWAKKEPPNTQEQVQQQARKQAEEGPRMTQAERQRRVIQINHEIFVLNQEVGRLSRDLPIMSKQSGTMILVLIGGGIFMLTLAGISRVLLLVGVTALLLGFGLLLKRNSFYTGSYKPVLREIEKRKLRLHNLAAEKQTLINAGN
jgi:curved DNA-binding protein CbpA